MVGAGERLFEMQSRLAKKQALDTFVEQTAAGTDCFESSLLCSLGLSGEINGLCIVIRKRSLGLEEQLAYMDVAAVVAAGSGGKVVVVADS